jgi:hypothetical protein
MSTNNIDELRKPMTDVENTLYILQTLSTTESQDLEYAVIDVYYESDSGSEGASQYDMPMIADAAINTISEQAEHIGYLKSKIKSALSCHPNAIETLLAEAFEDTHLEQWKKIQHEKRKQAGVL